MFTLTSVVARSATANVVPTTAPGGFAYALAAPMVPMQWTVPSSELPVSVML